MKGMMVPLLVVMMTGMVIGQQPKTDENSTDSGSPKIGRFLLDMTDQWIESLRDNGLLQAPIKLKDREHINEIVIKYRAETSVADLIPAPITQLGSGSDGKLQFVLTDNDIEIMKRRGLRYTIREADRGKYDSVVVRYQNPTPSVLNNANGKPIRQTESNGFDLASARGADKNPPAGGNTEFGSSNYKRQSRGSTPLAHATDSVSRRRDSNLTVDDSLFNYENPRNTGNQLPNLTRRSDPPNGRRLSTNGTDPSYEPSTEKTFEGLPSSTDYWTNRQNNGQLDRQSVSSTTRTPNRRFENGFGPVANRSQNNERPADLLALQDRQAREEAEQLERQTIEVERLRAERLSRERIAVQKQLDRERYLKSLHGVRESDRIADDRYAMRSSDGYAYPYTDDNRPLIDYPTNRFPNRQSEDYGDRLVTANNSAPSLPPPRVTVGPRPSGPVPAAIGGPDGNNFDRLAQNTAENPNSENRFDSKTPLNGSTGTLAEMNTQMSRMRQTTGMLWFMMLCSLGLNVYLGWIARGFYVRYEELADELRETFTSTS